MIAVPVDGVPVRGPLTSAREARQRRDAALVDLQESSKELLRTLLSETTGLALDKVEQIAGRLDATAASGGVGMQGVLGGIVAGLQGRSPAWGAFTAAVAAMSPGMRAALILALVLAILLLPVTVVLVLLALIVAVVVAAVRS